MKCEATECGYTKGGLRVRAITDSSGSQVVVTDDQSPDGAHLLSRPLENHEVCISLANQVQRQGTRCYNDWGSPLGLFEFACICAQSFRNEVKTCR